MIKICMSWLVLIVQFCSPERQSVRAAERSWALRHQAGLSSESCSKEKRQQKAKQQKKT